MSSLSLWVGALVLLAASAGAAAARGAPDSFADLADRLLPSVVNISTTQTVAGGTPTPNIPEGSPFEEFFKEFFERQRRENQPRRRATSLGSGFILSAGGLIATNYHVIAEAEEISATLHDGTTLTAKVIGRDPKTDLALLKVESQVPLSPIKFGDSDKTRVGDWVLAIGNPFGLGGTVTAGIVSARSRDINAGPYDDFLQTDASINRGNSGGPMFNIAGEVIGINTAIFSPSGGSVGIGFAVPSNLARPVLEQLRAYGRTRRGWLGVRIQTVTDEIAQGLGLSDATGALIAAVTPDGPAEKGKLLVGDVVLSFDGKEVAEMRRLPRIVAETEVGKKVRVEVWRNGHKVNLAVAVAEFPEEQVAAVPPAAQTPGVEVKPTSVLGVEFARITPALRQRFQLDPAIDGVVVTSVADDSPVGQSLRPGDIVRKMGADHSEVTDPAQIVKKVDEARESKLKTILVLVESNGNQRFVALRLTKDQG